MSRPTPPMAARAALLGVALGCACMIAGCSGKDTIRIQNNQTGQWVEVKKNQPEFDNEKRRELLIRFREDPSSLAHMSPAERFELQRMRAAVLLKNRR